MREVVRALKGWEPHVIIEKKRTLPGMSGRHAAARTDSGMYSGGRTPAHATASTPAGAPARPTLVVGVVVAVGWVVITEMGVLCSHRPTVAVVGKNRDRGNNGPL